MLKEKVKTLRNTKNTIESFNTRVQEIDQEYTAKITAQEDQKKLVAAEEDHREKLANDHESLIESEGTGE